MITGHPRTFFSVSGSFTFTKNYSRITETPGYSPHNLDSESELVVHMNILPPSLYSQILTYNARLVFLDMVLNPEFGTRHLSTQSSTYFSCCKNFIIMNEPMVVSKLWLW